MGYARRLMDRACPAWRVTPVRDSLAPANQFILPIPITTIIK
jgi:hypothetical protein